MHFSTVTVALALAGSAVGTQMIRRNPIPYMPRALQVRQDACGGVKLAEGYSCCGVSGEDYLTCPSANPSCANGDNTYWCCPADQKDCPKPNGCGDNNGNCGDDATCDAQKGCVPKNPAAVMAPQGSSSPSQDQGAQQTPAAASGAAATASSAAEVASTAAAEASTAAENANAAATTAASAATGTETESATGTQAANPAVSTEAQSGASRLGGFSALALAFMAAVLAL